MTQATKICQHQNYELKCSAKVLDNGEYVPLLVITKQVWPTRPREIAVRRATTPQPRQRLKPPTPKAWSGLPTTAEHGRAGARTPVRDAPPTGRRAGLLALN